MITKPNDIVGHIERLKMEIETYKLKNENLIVMLNNFKSKNIVEHPRNIFEKTIYQFERNDNKVPVFMVIFFCCLGYIVGNILSKI